MNYISILKRGKIKKRGILKLHHKGYDCWVDNSGKRILGRKNRMRKGMEATIKQCTFSKGRMTARLEHREYRGGAKTELTR